MASVINSISISLLPAQTPFSSFSLSFSSSFSFSSSPSQISGKPDVLVCFAGISKRARRKTKRKPPQKDMSVSLPVSAPSRKQEDDEGDEPYPELIDGETAKVNQLPWDKEALLPMDVEGQTGPSNTIAHRKRSYLSSVTCFGVDLSPDNIAVAMVYFVQGVLGLSRLAVSFYLKDDLHLDPAETAVVSGVSALPWLIKPLYGFISDSFPLFGYRRRSYLVLSGFLGALSWTLMASLVDGKYGAAFCILLGSLSVAFSDVVVDSMVVERARGESQSTSGSLQSLCWGSSAFGGIVSAYFSGSLVDAYGVRFVFGITALLPLITSAVAVLVKEQRTSGSKRKHNHLAGQGFVESSKQSLIQLFGAIRQPNVFLPTLFIFLWQATPQSDSAMFYFTTNKLGFTPEFLGRVKLVTSVASLLGVGLYNGFLKTVPLRKIFLVTTIIGSALGMTQVVLVTGLNRQLGISDEWFAVGDSLILTVLGQASFMPVLVLAARLCPEGMEATLFATLMSISNGGSVVGGLIGAGLTQLFGVTRDSFGNLACLIVLCNLSSLLPLPLLRLLPKENPDGAIRGSAEVEMKSN